VLSLYAQLVTSATVAARQANLFVSDGVRTWLVLPPAATQAASLTYTYAWSEHASPLAVGTRQSVGIPGLVLEPGWSIGTSTALLDGADQWSGIYLAVLDTTIQGGPVELASVPSLVVEVVPGAMS
jgi:hypothetical protein